MILKTRGGGWDTYTQLARVKFMGLLAKDANNNRAAAAVASAGGGGGSSSKNAKVGPNYNNPDIIRKNLANAVRDQDVDEALRLVNILHPRQAPIIGAPTPGATEKLESTVRSNDYDGAVLALQLGPDLNIHRDGGHSLSRVACEKGFPEMLNLLLNNGIDIDITNDYKTTSLMVACRNESRNIANIECALLLILRGANLNLVNKGGQTALWAALQPPPSPEKMLIVKALIARGATVNGKPGGPVSLARHRMTRKRKNSRNRTRKN
jgi:ankyrin repeat protein